MTIRNLKGDTLKTRQIDRKAVNTGQGICKYPAEMQTFLANKKMFRPGHFKAEVIFVIRPTTVSQDFFSQTYQVTGSFKNVQRQVGKLALPFLFFLHTTK